MQFGARYGHSVQVIGKANDSEQIFLIYGGTDGTSAQRSTEYWSTDSLSFVQAGNAMVDEYSEFTDAIISNSDQKLSTLFAIGADKDSHFSSVLKKPWGLRD